MMNWLKSTLLCSLVIASLGSAFAQSNFANYWYFGHNAGIQFIDKQPFAIKNGKLDTEEGCVSIANQQGDLLFYTDGISVWNKEHLLMENGQELFGHPSSTQSGVVIPLPGSDRFFYLFTVDATAGSNGLCYSTVDVLANEGKGKVVEKNHYLRSNVTEKLTAVKHRNGIDYWVIAHGWNSNHFFAYLVSKDGVKPYAITSQIGTVHKGSTLNTQGYMKASPDGTQIALVLEENHSFEIFDFDNLEGKLSNPLLIKQKNSAYTYGIEFSPNGSILYVSAAGEGKIYQYNLQAGSPDSIKTSEIMVAQSPEKEWIGALQLANNGKIYFTQYKKAFLGCIEEPNKIGEACNARCNAVALGAGTYGLLGLPTFSQSFFVEATKELKVEAFKDKLEKGKSFVIENLHFENDKYNLDESDRKILESLATTLLANPSFSIEISGHTDNIGNKSYNLELSRKRAVAVMEFLLSKGVDAQRLSAKGMGSTLPISTNQTEEGRGKNRRVEIKVK